MARLLRRVKQERWYIDANEPLPADSLNDLKTQNNTLSVWVFDEQESNIDDVMLTLAIRSDTLSKVDLALFDETPLHELGLSFQTTAGATPIKSLQDQHRDIVGLTAKNVLEIAGVIRTEEDHVSYMAPNVREMVVQAVKEGKLTEADLNPKILSDLKRRALL